MKTLRKYILWILGIIFWFIFFMTIWETEIITGANVHKYILVITGICLAIYIWKSKEPGIAKLKEENQQLKVENEQLRQQVNQQFIQDILDKTENKQ